MYGHWHRSPTRSNCLTFLEFDYTLESDRWVEVTEWTHYQPVQNPEIQAKQRELNNTDHEILLCPMMNPTILKMFQALNCTCPALSAMGMQAIGKDSQGIVQNASIKPLFLWQKCKSELCSSCVNYVCKICTIDCISGFKLNNMLCVNVCVTCARVCISGF